MAAWVTRAPWPRGRQLGHVIVAGLLLQAAQFGGFYWAFSLGLPAALVALIQGLTPVLTATAAWLLLGERTGRCSAWASCWARPGWCSRWPGAWTFMAARPRP